MIAGKLATRVALLERARQDDSEPCGCVGRIYVVYEDEDGNGPTPRPQAPMAAKHAQCPHGRPYARWAVLYADDEHEHEHEHKED